MDEGSHSLVLWASEIKADGVTTL